MARTHRRPYTKSKRIDRSCRSHGGCPWCLGNRRHSHRKRVEAALAQVNELHGRTLSRLARS